MSKNAVTLLPALTGLRGVGASWVFLYHLLHETTVPVMENIGPVSGAGSCRGTSA